MKAIQIYYKLKQIYDIDQGKTLEKTRVDVDLTAEGTTYRRTMTDCQVTKSGNLVITAK